MQVDKWTTELVSELYRLGATTVDVYLDENDVPEVEALAPKGAAVFTLDEDDPDEIGVVRHYDYHGHPGPNGDALYALSTPAATVAALMAEAWQ